MIQQHRTTAASIRIRAWAIALACVWVLFAADWASAQENNRPPEGFERLFNGENLSGWTGGTTKDPEQIKALPETQAKAWRQKMDEGIAKHWRVETGELVSDGHEPHLVTDQDYGDFELYVDWKLGKNGDSGIYLRGVPQVQIWDPTNKAAHGVGSDKGSGGLWNNTTHERFPSEVADKPIGQWNRMYIRMVGPFVTVKLNGKLVVDNVVLENYYNPKRPVPAAGPIHLQTHGSETRFRNIFVREIPAEEANELLSEIAGDEQDYKSIFNGKDLSGWTGAVGSYEVVDGALLNKAGMGGNLITEQTYRDFAVRMEFKLPDAGNSGLAIRTPDAQVDAAGSALEIQILDNSHPNYANLNAYQYHGSAYGISPALRGYLREVGQWNYQVVRVVGDHVTVELNGYTILDAHLKKVNPKLPAAQRTTGHLGICAHSDPVAFRNLRVQQIE